jgi:hypothetical protein
VSSHMGDPPRSLCRLVSRRLLPPSLQRMAAMLSVSGPLPCTLGGRGVDMSVSVISRQEQYMSHAKRTWGPVS